MKGVFCLYPYVNFKNEKAFRLLDMYERLMKGEILNKLDLAHSYSVSEKTIQRDISDLRSYFAETRINKDENMIFYDKKRNGYHMINDSSLYLNHAEIISLCKLVLYTQAFSQSESDALIRKLIAMSASSSRREIEALLYSELQQYRYTMTADHRMDKIKDISEAIQNHHTLEITYCQNRIFRKEHIRPHQLYFYDGQFLLFSSADQEEGEFLYYLDWIVEIKEIKEENRQSRTAYEKQTETVVHGIRRFTMQCQKNELDQILKRYPTAKIIQQGESLTIEAVGSEDIVKNILQNKKM